MKGLLLATLVAGAASVAIVAGLRNDGREEISRAAVAAWPAFTGPSSVITENVRAIERTITAEYAAAHGRHSGGFTGQAAPAAIVPDPTLTPGAIRTTDIGEICSHGTRELRHWSRERDDHILAEYGLLIGPHPTVEIDHLVPLCLGGADSDLNLWPQGRRSIEPIWNAERKDVLEARACQLICAGQLDVQTAQREIAEDWTEMYRRYVGEPSVSASSKAAGGK